MYSMELVVERGKARCPRCVAVADYSFIELGPSLLRYEVNCGGCGETYRERLGPVVPKVGAGNEVTGNRHALAPIEDWLPAVKVPAVPVRVRLDAWVGMARGRAAALSTSMMAALRARRQTESVVEPVG